MDFSLPMQSLNYFSDIITLLEKNKIPYQLKEHLPTPTSEESAKARGEPLKIGAKALILKDDTHFLLVVIPADRKLDTKKLKKILNTKNIRFVTIKELFELTCLVPGAVPPFGNLFNLPMLVDQKLWEEEYMAFNAGSREKSIKMKTRDYQNIVHPKTDDFST